MTTAKGGRVSEKMQRAVRKLQHRIANSNQPYQNLLSSSDEMSAKSAVRRRASLSRSNRSSSSEMESDEDGRESPPYDVPEGFLAVYVGREKQRFVISAEYLNHAVFRILLEKSAEEFGFEHKGGLPIACDVAFFEHLLWLMESKDPALSKLDINELCGLCAYAWDSSKLSDGDTKPQKKIRQAAFASFCKSANLHGCVQHLITFISFPRSLDADHACCYCERMTRMGTEYAPCRHFPCSKMCRSLDNVMGADSQEEVWEEGIGISFLWDLHPPGSIVDIEVWIMQWWFHREHWSCQPWLHSNALFVGELVLHEVFSLLCDGEIEDLNGEQESGDFMAANLFVCGIQLADEGFFPLLFEGRNEEVSKCRMRRWDLMEQISLVLWHSKL